MDGEITDYGSVDLEAFAAGGANPISLTPIDPFTFALQFAVPLLDGDNVDVANPTGLVFAPAGDIAPGGYPMHNA